MMRLRDYQVECRSAVRSAMAKGEHRVVAELATGLGKAIIAAVIGATVKERGKRCLILANRNVLIRQMADKLQKACNVVVKINQGDQRATLNGHPEVYVSSVQTMQGKELERWPDDYFDVVISDEWHFCTGKQWRSILDRFQTAYHIGLTATAERHDGQSLAWPIVYDLPLSTRADFDKLTLERREIVGAVERGWLVPYERVEIPVPITIDDLIKKKNITEEDESFHLKSYLPRLAKEVSEQIRDSKAILFFPECKASEAFSELLREQGIDAKHIDSTYMPAGKTEDLLRWFATVKKGCLTNASLLTTGYDQPDIDTVGIIRLIRSTPLYRQIVGRGTRVVANVDAYSTPEERRAAIAASTKPKLRILDLLLQHDEHDLCSAACLVANIKSEERAIAAGVRKRGGDPADSDLLKAVAEEVRLSELQRQESLKKVAEQVANASKRRTNYKTAYIADILKSPDNGPVASEKQLGYLRYLGMREFPESPLTKYQASRCINRWIAFKERE